MNRSFVLSFLLSFIKKILIEFSLISSFQSSSIIFKLLIIITKLNFVYSCNVNFYIPKQFDNINKKSISKWVINVFRNLNNLIFKDINKLKGFYN